MRNVIIFKFPFIFLSIFVLIIAQHDVGSTEISDNDKLNNMEEEDPTEFKEKLIKENQSSDNDKRDYKQYNGDTVERYTSLWDDRIRQKRSLTPYEENVDLEPLTNVRDQLENIFSANDYNSNLQAGKHHPSKDLDASIVLDDMIKDKRIDTDYGYGSRLQAAENIAMDWDRNGLFGVMGPGKRSTSDILNNHESAKRVPTDFGYGSRNRAAEIAAMSSNGGLYGLYGPGKRSNLGIALIRDKPDYEVGKRFTDYGYGSRLQAAEKVADSASRGGLFGDHGPGKRTRSGLLNDFESKFLLERLRKRISSDFGYGSREQAAENIAKSKAKGSIFGVYGPGKRSE